MRYKKYEKKTTFTNDEMISTKCEYIPKPWYHSKNFLWKYYLIFFIFYWNLLFISRSFNIKRYPFIFVYISIPTTSYIRIMMMIFIWLLFPKFIRLVCNLYTNVHLLYVIKFTKYRRLTFKIETLKICALHYYWKYKNNL